MTISFVSIFTYVWITRNKSMEPLKTRQDVTPETLTFAADRAIYENPYRIGVQVSHKIFGIGEIIDVSKDGGTFQVKFSDGSVKFLRQAFLSIV